MLLKSVCTVVVMATGTLFLASCEDASVKEPSVSAATPPAETPSSTDVDEPKAVPLAWEAQAGAAVEVIEGSDPISYRLTVGMNDQVTLKIADNGVSEGDTYSVSLSVTSEDPDAALYTRIARDCTPGDVEQTVKITPATTNPANVEVTHTFTKDYGCARVRLNAKTTQTFIISDVKIEKVN